MRTWWSPLPQLSVFLAHSDEKLEPINGYQRVNRDFGSKERLLVLYSFVNERCRHVREAKEGGREHGWRPLLSVRVRIYGAVRHP